MKIGYVRITGIQGVHDHKTPNGGNVWNKGLINLLSEHFDTEVIYAGTQKSGNLIYQIRVFYNLLKIKGKKDIWIRDYLPTITLPFNSTVGRNISIIHHVDSNYLAYPTLCKLMDKIIYYNLKNVDTLVVVSEYWKEHFESLGHNVKLIYNYFDFNEFKFTDEEIVTFKQKYNLSEKPIIYLGNCQKSKGVVEAYNELKDLDVHLVTSGEKRVDIPAINLNLSYRDYLLLLKASSVVVTMSKFKEGWCRTAHEAMLCKTPVVGSGMGGMEELLVGGEQIICKDYSDLRGYVEYLLVHPELGEKGYEYASQEKFTVKQFENSWIELIEEVIR